MLNELQELIKFYETLNKSRALVLTKLTPQANVNVELKSENNVKIASKDNALIVSHRIPRTNDPDDGSLSWTATFKADEISLEYVRTEWGSGFPSADYIDTYTFIIKNGSIIRADHSDQSFSDFGDSHCNTYELSELIQQNMLEDLKKLISSASIIEAAMAEYKFKVNATPIAHGFFKTVKTELSSSVHSTTKEVEDIMLNYLG